MTSDPMALVEDGDDWFADASEHIDPREGMWDWVDDDTSEPEISLTGHDVLAVLVTRDAQDWLPRTIEGLGALQHQPTRLIAIDNVSRDETDAVLAAAKADGILDAVYKGDADWGFGEAIDSAIALDAQAAPAHGQELKKAEWLWLLHDDAVPAPDALRYLIEQGVRKDDIAVVVPMLMQAMRRGGASQISELGTSITATGVRQLSLEQGEINQGQYESSAVLGSSTCGLLVRRSAWDELGGFSTAIPRFRDGTEFGWRANLAGYQVVTAPKAIIEHRQVGRAGLRRGVPHPTVDDRVYGMMTVAAHHHGVGGALSTIWLVLATLLRALGFLLGKAPGRAMDELRAARLFLGSGNKVRRLRSRINKIDTTHESVERVQSLRPRWYAAVTNLGNLIATEASDWWNDTFGTSSSSTSIDDLMGDDFATHRDTKRRRPWLLPTTVTFLLLFLLSLLAGRNIYGGGHLTSWHLLPAPDTLSALYQSYLDPIAGAPRETAPPWVGLVALCSTLFAGQPEWFIATLFIFAVPLSALSGYAFLRQVAGDRRARLVGAVLYGTLPALLGAVSRGQLGIIVWAIVVPLLGVAVLTWRRRGTAGYESWRGAFQVALCLTVLASFTPLILVFALIVAIVAALRSRRMAQIMRICVALLVPTLLLSPWIPTLLAHPGRIFTGDDPVLDGMATVNGPLLFLGRTPGEGLPALWLSATVFGVVWLLALAGMVLRPYLVRVWVGTSLGAFAFAIVLTKLVVVVPPAGSATRPAAGLWLLLAFAALIAAAAVGFEEVASTLATRSFGLLQGLTILALLGSVVVVAMGTLWWVKAGMGAPMQRTTFTSQPSYVRQAQTQNYQVRSLVIDLGNADPSWDVKEGDGTRLGDGERGPAFGGAQAPIDMTREAVADIASGRSDDALAERLSQLGIGYITVRNGSSDALAAVNAIPGLMAPTGEESSRTWRVSATPSRAVVAATGEKQPVNPDGTEIAAGSPARQLIISAPADPRWRATLNGQQLEMVPGDDDDFRQYFAVGERSGVIKYELVAHPWWALAQLLGLLVLIVLVFPSLRRTETRDPAQYARRAARLEEQD